MAALRPGIRGAVVVTAVAIATACSGRPTPGDSPDPQPVTVRAVEPLGPGAIRPVVVDTDLDADDLVALTILAGEPGVRLLAVTVSGTGIVHCDAGVDIARRWLALLGNASVPVACGREEPGAGGRSFPADWRRRADDLFGLSLPVVPAPVAPADSAAELLVRVTASADEDVTIVALGPWTNLADAVRLDAALPGRIRELHAMIGAVDVPGNLDAGDTRPDDRVEWNAGADPEAVATLLTTDVPITIVPLDATNDVPLTAQLVDGTAGVGAGTGADLVSQLYLREPTIATSGQSLWDSLAAVLLADPRPATWSELRLVVATTGRAAGAFGRSERGRPIRAALGADPTLVTPAWLEALTRTKVRITPDGRFQP